MSRLEEGTENRCRLPSPETPVIRYRSRSPKRYIFHDINDMIRMLTHNQTEIPTCVQTQRGRSQVGASATLETVGRKLDRLDISTHNSGSTLKAGAVRSPKKFHADEDSDKNDPGSATL